MAFVLPNANSIKTRKGALCQMQLFIVHLGTLQVTSVTCLEFQKWGHPLLYVKFRDLNMNLSVSQLTVSELVRKGDTAVHLSN